MGNTPSQQGMSPEQIYAQYIQQQQDLIFQQQQQINMELMRDFIRDLFNQQQRQQQEEFNRLNNKQNYLYEMINVNQKPMEIEPKNADIEPIIEEPITPKSEPIDFEETLRNKMVDSGTSPIEELKESISQGTQTDAGPRLLAERLPAVNASTQTDEIIKKPVKDNIPTMSNPFIPQPTPQPSNNVNVSGGGGGDCNCQEREPCLDDCEILKEIYFLKGQNDILSKTITGYKDIVNEKNDNSELLELVKLVDKDAIRKKVNFQKKTGMGNYKETKKILKKLDKYN